MRYQEPPEDGAAGFVYRRGSIPVVISAPHSAVHTRDGRPKEEEEYTAALAQLAATHTGAHVLYLRRRSSTDPNWYCDVPYKACLARVVAEAGVQFVLDIHGCARRRDFGVALGTMRGASCPGQREAIIAALARHGFRTDAVGTHRLDLDETFTGTGRRGRQTITRYAWEVLHVPAAQLEINEQMRVVWRRPDASLGYPFRARAEDVVRVLHALIAVVHAVVQPFQEDHTA